jgi:predicted nuclease of predicted toxin-antitoxin system
VSKDGDFHQLSFLHGHPPKVVWVRLGNCSTAQLLTELHRCRARIGEFLASESASLLVLP